MPVDPITSAIVSSVIGTAIQGALTPEPTAPMSGLVRELPESTLKGLMQPPLRGQVRIDGKTYYLAPAVQVRNDMNMLVFPEMILERVKVRYAIDYMGAVNRIWILSSAEAALPENR